MKKGKSKSFIKATRKSIKKGLEVNLADQITVVIEKLGHDPVKTRKEIRKSARRIAKKLSDQIQIGKAELLKELEHIHSETPGSPEQVMQHADKVSAPEVSARQVNTRVRKKPVRKLSRKTESSVL